MAEEKWCEEALDLREGGVVDLGFGFKRCNIANNHLADDILRIPAIEVVERSSIHVGVADMESFCRSELCIALGRGWLSTRGMC